MSSRSVLFEDLCGFMCCICLLCIAITDNFDSECCHAGTADSDSCYRSRPSFKCYVKVGVLDESRNSFYYFDEFVFHRNPPLDRCYVFCSVIILYEKEQSINSGNILLDTAPLYM